MGVANVGQDIEALFKAVKSVIGLR